MARMTSDSVSGGVRFYAYGSLLPGVVVNDPTVVGYDPGTLGKWPRPRPTIHQRRQRVARWLAWKRHGGQPSEYVDLSAGESCLDGWFTPDELRRIADAADEYARIMEAWHGD